MLDHPNQDVWIFAQTQLPTLHGEFEVYVFRNRIDHKEHLAIVSGDVRDRDDVPVRIHSECLTSEVLGSLKCDCREQLNVTLQEIARQDSGVVLYMRQEGRGIGLGNKIRAYALQQQGLDTVEANHRLGFPDDLRRYDIAAEMLRLLGVNSVRLITNNPNKIKGLEDEGILVRDRIPLVMEPNLHNIGYLQTKAAKSGHLLPELELTSNNKALVESA